MPRPLILAFLLGLLASCGKGEALPDDLPGLRTLVQQSRDQARAARAERDPKKAALAGERAKNANEHADALVKGRDLVPEDKAGIAAIHADAREAWRLARLTAEEKEIHDRTTGLKAKAYRGGRKAALGATFLALALAADQEAKGGPVPQGLHESALLGAELSEHLAGRSGIPGDVPDWPGVSSDLRRLSQDLPPETSTFLALALVLTRQDGLALIEIESAEAKTFRDPAQVVGHLMLRGVILRLNGLPESAGESFREAGAAPTPEASKAFGQELQAGIHLAIAASEIFDKNYEGADLEIVRAMKAWPNNPVAVFLTGERLGAMGEREAAARSLEASLAGMGPDQEWIAKKIAARARELRDGQGPAEPLLFDPSFLRDVAFWQIWQAAKTSPPAKRLQQLIEAARAFAARWTPGGGGSEK